jgi:hypothetical protein
VGVSANCSGLVDHEVVAHLAAAATTIAPDEHWLWHVWPVSVSYRHDCHV